MVDSFDDLSILSLEELIDRLPDPPTDSPKTPEIRKKSVVGNVLAKEGFQAPRKSSVPPLPDNQKFNFQVLLSSCTGEITKEQRQQVYQMLLKLDPDTAQEQLNKAYNLFMEPGREQIEKGAGTPVATPDALKRKGSLLKLKGKLSFSGSTSTGKGFYMTISKSVIDFGLKGMLCPLKEEMVEEITFGCKVGRAKYNFVVPPPSGPYSLKVIPDSGTFGKKKGDIKTVFSVTLNSTIYLEEVISLEVEGVGRFFFIVKVQGERSLFGEELSQYYSSGKVTIPPVLEQLKEHLIANGGLSTKEIFRASCPEPELLLVKDQINREIFEGCEDICIIANLIKIWFRELPVPLLQGISENLLMSAEGQYEFLSLCDMLKEPNNSIFKWLLELLGDVVLNTEANGMTASGLAAVIAPNLYVPASQNLERQTALPGKIAMLITHLINYRLTLR